MIFPGRLPAYLELRPREGKWETAPGELAARISRWTGLAGAVERLASGVPAPQGYYRVVPKRGQAFFVKVLPGKAADSQREADRIARWLESRGISVSCLIDGFPRDTPGELCALAYQHVEGRFANATESDLARLGTALAALHGVLRDCPWRAEIRDRGLQRDRELVGLLAKLRQGGSSSEPVPAEVLSLLAAEAEPDLMDVLAAEPQVVHGDLNYGNVLFVDAGERVVFLDHEDTRTSWFSPLAELSFVIERFALQDDDGLALRLSHALIDAYAAGGGASFGRRNPLADILRALSVRSLLLLVLVQENRAWEVPGSEWTKFLDLYRQASSRTRLLEKISDCL